MSGRKIISDRALGVLGRVACDVPVRPKGSAAWSIASRKVAYNIGETAADAESFAAALVASATAYRAAHPAREATGLDAMYENDAPIIVTINGASVEYQRPARPTVPPRGAVTPAMVMARIASVPLGYTVTPAGDLVDPYREPSSLAPDPITTCNACELRPMVGPEHAGYAAGLCAECYSEATAPEPVRDWRGPDAAGIRDVLHAVAHGRTGNVPEPVQDDPSADVAPVTVSEPIAPAIVAPKPEPVRLASVPDVRGTRERPTCGKCGQTFRASGNGLA